MVTTSILWTLILNPPLSLLLFVLVFMILEFKYYRKVQLIKSVLSEAVEDSGGHDISISYWSNFFHGFDRYFAVTYANSDGHYHRRTILMPTDMPRFLNNVLCWNAPLQLSSEPRLSFPAAKNFHFREPAALNPTKAMLIRQNRRYQDVHNWD